MNGPTNFTAIIQSLHTEHVKYLDADCRNKMATYTRLQQDKLPTLIYDDNAHHAHLATKSLNNQETARG